MLRMHILFVSEEQDATPLKLPIKETYFATMLVRHRQVCRQVAEHFDT